MNYTDLVLKEWADQENPYGPPFGFKTETQLWEILLKHFQERPAQQYLKHFHEYRFTADEPEELVGIGIGRSRKGRYKEVLKIYWQDQ